MSTTRRHDRARPRRQQGSAACAVFLATMLAWPASADFDIPDDPLTTGARVPPNILFILDDSGSMNFVAMPASVQDRDDSSNYGSNVRDGLEDNPADRSYLNNAIYYNPNVDYDPWTLANGSLMTGGTNVGSVFAHWNYASGATRDLRGNSESIFYVPKTGVTSSTDPDDFDRYRIDGDGVVVRMGAPASLAGFPRGPLNSGMDPYTQRTFSVPVPAGSSLVQVYTTGGGTGVDLYLMRPNGTQACRSRNGNGGESCAVSNPVSGNWEVRVYRDSGANFSNVHVHALTASESAATPTGRGQAEELLNIATWYSYHRTRMKAAKAGASKAFGEIGSTVRVGFRTIWGRNGNQDNSNWPTQDDPIPVNYNDGLFDDIVSGGVVYDNRTKWYSRLHSTYGSGGTPLHGALHQAGRYFSSDESDGPYGPQSGDNQLACRQNFSILTTDGYWNNFSNYPSGSYVGNSDGTAGAEITEPSTEDSYTYVPGPPYSDAHSGSEGTLADVAMHYWKTDLRTDLRNVVPHNDNTNPAFWQHMVTFGLSIGLRGNTGFSSVGDVPDTYTGWPNPMNAEDGDRIDDLLHAAVNSRGTFVAASNPDEFTSGLQSALAAIVERTGSFSNVAANSTAIDTGARVFQANYVSGVWTGELRSQAVTLSGVEEVDCSDVDPPDNGWCASRGIPTTDRKLFTSNGHSNGATTTSGTEGLVFPDDASDDQLQSLERLAPAWQYPVTGEENAAYIAGERDEELSQGGELRNRNHLLGDIVGSSPAYVRETNTIYVGANDGMLHAIDASDGSEEFAFIPGIINWNDLGTLSRPDYLHRYFVDGPVVVTSTQQTPGEHILVGALGKGGKGLFSLDVTNPGEFDEDDFKWERAETPGGHMGLIQGRPIIARVANGDNAIVLGNGVNSANNRAVLIVLDLDTGEVIREIDTGAGSALLPNGLSAPAGILGQDGRTLAYVYAGDMLGNVWKFDLSDPDPDEWGVRKLFEAGTTRPISGAVTVATHPVTNQRWIFFGTGRYLTAGDVTNTATQGMYGFMEHEEDILDAGDLTERTLSVTSGTNNGYPVRAFQAREQLPATSSGWYINLPETGERIVQDAQVVSTFLVTASMIPMGDACESDGRGYINALDAFSGTSAGGSYFDLDGDGSTSDEMVSGQPVGSVNVDVGMPTLPNLLRGLLVVGGSAGSGVGSPQTLSPRWDRASWREIRGE